MKLYKSITLLAITSLGMVTSACSDWLDYEPKDSQTYNKVYSSEVGFHTVVNGIYNQVNGSSLYGVNLSYGAIEVMGRCYNIPSSNTTFNEICSSNYTGSEGQSYFSGIWSTAYNTLLNVNVLLEALDEFPDVLTKRDNQMLKGEMLGVRAMLHLDLARLFGPAFVVDPDGLAVPYADSPKVIKRERLTATDIFTNKIIPDLDESQRLLKEVDPVITDGVLNSDGGYEGNWYRYRQLRLNYYAVTLLKARAYIWMGDMENALIEAQKITDDPKVLEIFPWVDPSKLLGNGANPDRVFSTECLYGMYNSSLSDIYSYKFIGTLDASLILQPAKGYISRLFTNSSDYRRQSQWVVSTSESGDYDFVKYKSFIANEDTPEFWATFYGLMRTSEAYFIAAEAKVALGDIPGGVRYLNVVRAARGETAIRENVRQAAFEKEIKLEYLRDLRGEGQIFFLHKRHWQEFSSTDDQNAFNAGPTIEKDYVNLRYEIPIPQSENY